MELAGPGFRATRAGSVAGNDKIIPLGAERPDGGTLYAPGLDRTQGEARSQ